jgi:FkbM family methyltransferase
LTAEVDIQAQGGIVHLRFPHENDHIATVIRQSGTFYEAEMLDDVRARLFFPVCAVDVGAHVGNHTTYFAKVLGLRTLSYEPNPVNFAHLVETIERNKLGDRCTLRNVAVGAVAGRSREGDHGGSNSGMARVVSDPDGAIEVVTLDGELVGEPRIDVVKIDVEGWELEVLQGARETLARHRPLVYVEAEQSTFESLCTDLRAAGYICWKRFNATPTFLFLPRERLGA